MTGKRKLTTGKIVIYCVIFFAVWTFREIVVRPVWLNQFDGLTWHILESSMKLLVWTLSAILLIKYFQDDMCIGLKEMFTTKPRWFKGAWIVILIMLLPIFQALIFGGRLSIDPNFESTSLIQGVMFAGITEELVFRGFLLNTFLKRMKMWKAILLDAALFALIHFPIWIYSEFTISDFLLATPQVMLLSTVFAYSFIKTKNIFIPIAIHMLWNLLVITLYFGG